MAQQQAVFELEVRAEYADGLYHYWEHDGVLTATCYFNHTAGRSLYRRRAAAKRAGVGSFFLIGNGKNIVSSIWEAFSGARGSLLSSAVSVRLRRLLHTH